MTKPDFGSLEQLGLALTSYWLDYIEKTADKNTPFSRLVASGDDDEACLSHLEWTCNETPHAALIGFPDTDNDGNTILFPESIDDCYEYQPLLELTERFASRIGISTDSEYLAESQLLVDLVGMLRYALNFEMLSSMETVRQKLVAQGFTFVENAAVGIYRHDYTSVVTLEEFLRESETESLEFCTEKLNPHDVVSEVAEILYATYERKQWFKSHDLWIVECEL